MTRSIVWESKDPAGGVDDCSAYMAWRGRSEETALDDFDLKAATEAATLLEPLVPQVEVAASVTAPGPAGETFRRFG